MLEAALWLAAVALAFAAGRLRAGRKLGAANAELFRESARVRLLEYAAVAANEAGSLDQAMEAGVRRICLAMGWPVGRIHVVEAEGTLQETASFVAHGNAAVPGLLDTAGPGGDSLAQRALASGRPQGAYDLASRTGGSRSRLARELGVQTALSVPVVSHGRVVAVLVFATRERLPPDPHVLDTLALVGVQLGRVAERAAVEQRLRQAQKLEAIGKLSAGIAHEINNPMAFVRSNLNHLASEWKRLRGELETLPAGAAISLSVSDCDALIHETLEGVERTVSIVRDMMEFSHLGDDERVTTDLREIVDTALRVASSQMPPGVTLERRDVGESPPPFSCCPNQLIQVLVNLVVNAIEAASPTGRVEVATTLEDDHAVIQVEDTGAGMSAEARDRIVDPLFAGATSGDGRGLGLAISNEIVRKHGGEIRVFSAEGAGTVVEVRLPV